MSGRSWSTPNEGARGRRPESSICRWGRGCARSHRGNHGLGDRPHVRRSGRAGGRRPRPRPMGCWSHDELERASAISKMPDHLETAKRQPPRAIAEYRRARRSWMRSRWRVPGRSLARNGRGHAKSRLEWHLRDVDLSRWISRGRPATGTPLAVAEPAHDGRCRRHQPPAPVDAEVPAGALFWLWKKPSRIAWRRKLWMTMRASATGVVPGGVDVSRLVSLIPSMPFE